jgi:hypothetical protein
MQESDPYPAIQDQGWERATRDHILVVGELRLGAATDVVRSRIANVTELYRLERMHRRAVKAASWQELLDTP